MGAKLGENADDLAENADINITPFIDVMLVLLIIFMIAAPLSTVDVNVDLPASTAKPQKPTNALIRMMAGREAIPRAPLKNQ